MPNEVFVPKNSRRGYNNPLRKKKQKQENIIDGNCVKSTQIREKKV